LKIIKLKHKSYIMFVPFSFYDKATKIIVWIQISMNAYQKKKPNIDTRFLVTKVAEKR